MRKAKVEQVLLAPVWEWSAAPMDVLAEVGARAIERWAVRTPQRGLRLCPCCGGVGVVHEAGCVVEGVVELVLSWREVGVG